MDGKPRLDPKGYHATPAPRPDTEARWDCTTTKADDDWLEGKAIVAHQTVAGGGLVELKLKVGDDVYLSGAKKGYPAEIGKIVMFFAAPGDDHIWMRTRWFWRPERTEDLPDSLDWHERELFTEEHTKPDDECDENSTAAIELTPVRVLPYDPSQMDLPWPAHTFFTRRKYNKAAKKISDLVPKDAMEVEGTAAAPAAAPAAPAAAPAAKPRRNEQKERLRLLEELVATLQGRIAALELR
jgi:hypothetical protein